MTFAAIILLLVTAERLGELWLARRNTTALLKQGAFEVAPQHYTLIVLLHGFWLAGLWVLGWDQPVNLLWLAVFLVLQVLRVWVLATLGRRWTTRIIVLKSLPLVTTGPYRWLQVLRVWVLATLGRRWTTRIIVLPGEQLVATGPYRWLTHPNYVVVIGEIAVLPLCLGLPWYALAFSLANAAVLTVRIRAENAALLHQRNLGHL